MKRIVVFFSITLIFMAVACKSKQDVSEATKNSDSEISQGTTPEILTISFRIDNLDSLNQIEAVSNYGKLKERKDSFLEMKEGDLKILFLNIEGQVCNEKIVPNPLLKRIEYSDDDTSGNLISKKIELKESEFFVRLQWEECIQQIQIERIKDGEWETLKTISFIKPRIQ